ncbi:MAG: stage V sporulation protein AD [Bacillota bacterium]|nr:stage V sporulation protein AD [Bacillota bacterium]
MANKRIGKQTVQLENPPSILSAASIVGPKEGEGPLRMYFDMIIDDELWGEKSWEKAESKLMRETIDKLLSKSGISNQSVNYILAGDLLNQISASTFALRDTGISFLGVYGACSTMTESMSLGSFLVDGKFADNVICITSSHFCSAEKQFRYPLELGSQRPPTAQWTVTGSGGVLLSSQGSGPYITHVTTGKIVDMGIKDANNMGAAMAPAAADTLVTHFKDTGIYPDSYDLILTGDLGTLGMEITNELMKQQGYDISDRYNDCGAMIYDVKRQDAHCGGSGCGCSATVFGGFVYQELLKGNLNNVLFIATGALLSPSSSQQGESIPGIAHAVAIHRNLS